jgi:hypothetical protein
MTEEILQNLTANLVFRKAERENLRKLASKITKVPDIIKIPKEYLTDL